MVKRTMAFLFIALLLFPSSLLARSTHYVCSSAAGTEDGSSWDNCWGFAVVFGGATKWCAETAANPKNVACANLVGPGDTVYVDGGASPSGVTYSTQWWTYGAGYDKDSPITIGLHQTDTDHNFKVTYDPDNATDNEYVYLKNNFVVLNGNVGGERRILVKDTHKPGIQSGNKGVKLLYIEVTNCALAMDLGQNVGVSFTLPSGVVDTESPIEIAYNYIHDQPYNVGTESRQKNLQLMKGASDLATGYGGILVHHNTFENAQGDHIETAADSVDIYNNTFSNDCELEVYDAIHAFGRYYRIYNNSFDYSGNVYPETHADSIGGDGSVAGNIVFENNIMKNSCENTPGRFEGSFSCGVDGYCAGLQNLRVVNNTFYSTGSPIYIGLSGNSTSENCGNNTIANNVLVDAASAGYIASLSTGDGTVTYGGWGSESNFIYDYNLVYASSGSYTTRHYMGARVPGTVYSYPDAFKAVCTYGDVACQTNHQTIAPSLDASLIPTALSPARDTGVDLSSVTQLPLTSDYGGTTRPKGAAWDIGAYEYVPSTLGTQSLSGGSLGGGAMR